MRFIAYLILFASIICAVPSMAQVNVTYTFQDFVGNPQAVKRATLTSLQPFADYNGAILTASPTIKVTDTNGSVTFSNVVAAYSYRIQLDTPYGSTVRTSGFPAGLTGNVNGRDHLGTYAGQVFAFFSLTNASSFVASTNPVTYGTLTSSGPATFNDDVVLSGFASGSGDAVLLADSGGAIISSGVSGVALSYIENLSSDAQVQLNSKLNTTNSTAYGQTNFGGLWVKTNAFTPLAEIRLDSGQNLYLGPSSSGAFSMYWNDQHAPYGEAQLASYGSIAIQAGLNAAGGSVIQMGKSGASHERVQFQYDYNIGAGAFQGFSKLVNWVGIYSVDGANYANTYVGMQGFNVNTNGDMTLKFYNPSPTWSGAGNNSATQVGGAVQAEVRTNGSLFNGVMDRQLATPVNSASGTTNTIFVDFNRADMKTITVASTSATNLVLVSSNLTKITDGRSVALNIVNGSVSNTVAFPNWVFVQTNAVLTGLPAGNVALLELTAFGSNDTSIRAKWNVAPQAFTNSELTAFITATGASYTYAQKAALDTFISSSKTHSYNSKIILYPFIGDSGDGVANSKDLFGAHNMTWSNSVTHGSSSVTFNGTSFGNMGVSPSTFFSSKDTGMLFVWPTTASPTDNAYLMGATASGSHYAGLLKQSGNNTVAGLNLFSTASGQTVSGDFRHFIAANRTGASAQDSYVDNNASPSTPTSTGLLTYNIYLGGRNDTGTFASGSTYTAIFAGMGNGMTAQNMLDLYADLAVLKTALGK